MVLRTPPGGGSFTVPFFYSPELIGPALVRPLGAPRVHPMSCHLSCYLENSIYIQYYQVCRVVSVLVPPFCKVKRQFKRPYRYHDNENGIRNGKVGVLVGVASGAPAPQQVVTILLKPARDKKHPTDFASRVARAMFLINAKPAERLPLPLGLKSPILPKRHSRPPPAASFDKRCAFGPTLVPSKTPTKKIENRNKHSPPTDLQM